MMSHLKTIVVEDEPLAREGLLSYLSRIDFITVTTVCEDAIQANQHLASEVIDLMFLDIQMPTITGIDFLKSLKQPPMVVLTTAFPNFAIQGFELDVLDYLIKPFPFERLLKSVNKAHDYYLLKNKSLALLPDFFFVKCDYRYEKILYREVIYVEGLENYVIIHTTTQKFVTLMRLKAVEKLLSPAGFMRIHKSFIVAVQAITAIDGNELLVGSKRLPMSREKKPEIMKLLLRDKEG